MPNQKQTTKIKIPILRIIPLSTASAVWNMAADEYLMQHSEVPVLRFYQWQKPTLSFGSSFGNSLAHRLAALKELDFQTIRDFDLDGVIRKTGGKTVLHQYELTYSFIAPNFPLGILDSYQKISTILQNAFASFSLDCQLQKKPKTVTKSLNCFQEISSYELEVNKKKLVGSAQKRQKNKMLQHGAILLDIDWQLWARLWQLNQDYLKKRITSFKEIMGNIPSVTVLTEKIALEFSKSFAAKLERTDFSIAEKNSIEKLCPSYYFDDFYSLKNEQPNKKKEPLLRVENLTTQFKINEEWFSAVQEISFSIARSQVVGIIGESGCGKSVTAASLLRLLPARKARIQQGKIFFKEQEISRLSMDEFYPLRGKEISMIFQDPLSSLNPVLKIKEQLLEVWEKSQREVAFKKVKNLLHQVGLGDSERILQSYPHQLSGGMRQRIMIAMALSFEPDLLIADEPTTALDVTVQAQILYLLEKLQKEKQMSLLLITHDMAIIAQMCDLVYVMYAGRIVESGTVEQIFYSPAHPYTQGLLGSISYKNHKKKLPTIAGTVPALTDKTKGCPFFARCSQKEPRCNLKHPGFSKKQEGHLFACYNPR